MEWRVIFMAVCLLPLLSGISKVVMVSKKREIKAKPGGDVQLDCQFSSDYYRIFATPPVWSKEQLEENVEINAMGVLSSPFIEAARFYVDFENGKNTFNLKLKIQDLQPVDTGNYTCSVKGPRSNTLAQVTHLLVVSVPLKSVKISGPDVNPSNSLLSTLHNNHNINFLKTPFNQYTLVIKELETTYVKCFSISSYPPPEVVIKVGNHSVNGFFNRKVAISTTGQVGLKLIKYEVTFWTDTLKLRHENDEQVLECQARLEPGVVAARDAVNIHVLYKPHISCPKVHFYTGQHVIKLACSVKSRPNLQALRWALDEDKELFVDNTSTYGEYNFIVRDLSEDTIEVVLMILIVNQHTFRDYTLIAENLIGVGRQSTRIIKNYPLDTNTTEDSSELGLNATRLISLAQTNNKSVIFCLIDHFFYIILSFFFVFLH